MRILITGGSANGKSTFAEKLAISFPAPLYYLATMEPFGEESRGKIERHRVMRAEKQFATIELYRGVSAAEFPKDATLLLECMCNLAANEMFDASGNIDGGAFERVLRDVLELSRRSANIIVVTNDVGSDIVPELYSAETLRYVDVLSRLNIELAREFDTVYEVVAGIPLLLKGAAA